MQPPSCLHSQRKLPHRPAARSFVIIISRLSSFQSSMHENQSRQTMRRGVLGGGRSKRRQRRSLFYKNNKRRGKKVDGCGINLPDETSGAAVTRGRRRGAFQELKERGAGRLASGPLTCGGRAAIFHQTGTTGDAGLLCCPGGPMTRLQLDYGPQSGVRPLAGILKDVPDRRCVGGKQALA